MAAKGDKRIGSMSGSLDDSEVAKDGEESKKGGKSVSDKGHTVLKKASTSEETGLLSEMTEPIEMEADSKEIEVKMVGKVATTNTERGKKPREADETESPLRLEEIPRALPKENLFFEERPRWKFSTRLAEDFPRRPRIKVKAALMNGLRKRIEGSERHNWSPEVTYSQRNSKREKLDRPGWKLSSKLEHGYPFNRTLHMKAAPMKWIQRSQSEFEKQKQISEATVNRRLMVKALRQMQEKLDYLQNPRYSQIPGCVEALKLLVLDNSGEYLPLKGHTLVFDGYATDKVYTTELQILNVSCWSQRIRIVQPATQYFCVCTSEFPVQGRVLAPGKACNFSVVFFTKSTITVEDSIKIACEMQTCCLWLAARNPFPQITVPPVVNLGCCLIGHYSAESFSIINKGMEATFMLFSDDEISLSDAHHQMKTENIFHSFNSILWLPQFIVYPKALNLSQNESGDIVILFNPMAVKNYTFTLRITSERSFEWSTVVTGRGVSLHVSLEKIDGHNIIPGELDAGLWFGHAIISSYNSMRELTVRNYTQIALRYYWNIETEKIKGISDTGKHVEDKESYSDSAFVPDPPFGILNAGAEMSLILKFIPHKCKPYNQFASLYVDTRKCYPLNSTTWKHLKFIVKNMEYIGCNGDKQQDTCADSRKLSRTGSFERPHLGAFILSGGDNEGGIFKALQLSLIGVGETCDIQIVPPQLHFSDMLIQGKLYSQLVTLKNNSHVEICFSWNLSTTPLTVDSNVVTVVPWTGRIMARSQEKVEVTIMARAIGRLHEHLFCQLQFAELQNLILQVEGYVQGPFVTLHPVILDFGLVQVRKHSSLELTLKNESNVPTSFSLSTASEASPMTCLSCTYPEQCPSAWLAFSDYLLHQLPHSQYSSKTVDEKYIYAMDLPLQSSNFKENVSVDDLKEKINANFGDTIHFSPAKGTLFPNDSVIVKVQFMPVVCGDMKCTIFCQVANGLSATQYAMACAHIASPEICVSPSNIDLGITYLGLPVHITVTLNNLSGLPAHFIWSKETVGDHHAFDVEARPQDGVLAPRSKMEIIFNLLPKRSGDMQYTAVCEVSGMLSPIKLLFRSYISDIHCSYHVERPTSSASHELAQRCKYICISEKERQMHTYITGKENSFVSQESIDTSKLPSFDFGKRCPLGVGQSLRLVIKNQTAIVGHVTVAAGKYGVVPSLSNDQATLTSKSPLGFGQDRMHAYIPHDATQDSQQKIVSTSGQSTASQTIAVAMQESFVKESGNIALLIDPANGVLEAWKEWHCEIICFSIMPGIYFDVLHCTVGNLPTVEIPLSIGIVGTPLSVRESQVEPKGLRHGRENSCRVLKWGAAPAGHPPRTKRFWVPNTSPCPLVLDWEWRKPMANANESVKAELKVETEAIVSLRMLGDPDKGPVQINLTAEETVYVCLTLNELLLLAPDESCFQIEPTQGVFPKKLIMKSPHFCSPCLAPFL